MDLVIAWCRCGPLGQALEMVKTAPAGSSVEWSGNAKWVETGTLVAPDLNLLLAEADLCHWHTQVRPLRRGRLVAAHQTAAGLSLWVALSEKIGGGVMMPSPRGTLVFATGQEVASP
jgi:hypothetical protein